MYTTKAKINFYDCDPAGIMFFGNVYKLCHSVYEDFINSLPLDFDFWGGNDFAVPILHSEADYLQPLKTGDEISIEMSVLLLKKYMYELYFEIKNNNGELCDRVKTTHIFIDRETKKKIEMNDKIFNALKKHLK
ncbi:MAG: acyl-CoA thioesterase [Ignavibacteriales bacterium]|nr:acyl-CoA thioesterase [Ignavibacteriales bacterium]